MVFSEMLAPQYIGAHPSTKVYVSEELHIVTGVEPIDNNGTYKLHVSVAHSNNRRMPTDEEMQQVGKHFFGNRTFTENNSGATPGKLIRHLWED